MMNNALNPNDPEYQRRLMEQNTLEQAACSLLAVIPVDIIRDRRPVWQIMRNSEAQFASINAAIQAARAIHASACAVLVAQTIRRANTSSQASLLAERATRATRTAEMAAYRAAAYATFAVRAAANPTRATRAYMRTATMHANHAAAAAARANRAARATRVIYESLISRDT
jgi:hypothetical protein